MSNSRSYNETDLIDRMKPDFNIVILTGAGVSAESGIPTFRDAQEGLWAEYDPEELASPSGFRENPKLVFDWYDWRRSVVLRAQPNKAHQILAEWDRRLPKFTLITQNVDGLHQAAGSNRVIEMHGNIHRLVCVNKRHSSPWIEGTNELSRCEKCNSHLRPDIVWFGELLDQKILKQIKNALENADLFFAIGTSGMVYPAAGFLEQVKSRGGFTSIINKEKFLPGTADVQLEGLASEILGRLHDKI
jgi:NAD-dependent deacetylase